MKIGAYYVLYLLSPDDPSIQNKIIWDEYIHGTSTIILGL